MGYRSDVKLMVRTEDLENLKKNNYELYKLAFLKDIDGNTEELKICIDFDAYNVKKDLPFHKNGIMHLFEGSCRFHQKDQICDAA